MVASALIRCPDGGAPLDPGLRDVLESSFCVDLGGVRLHTGPQAEAFLRSRGLRAAAVGHRVFVPRRERGGGDRWLGILAHEIAHTIQQAQGAWQTGGWWERDAHVAAGAVLAGRSFPDRGLRAPAPGRGAAVLAGFNSWEHRLLGDVPGAEMVSIATRTGNWEGFVETQIRLMGLWQHGAAGVTAGSLRGVVRDIGLVTLPGSGCLATFGELNAVADYAANPAAVSDLPDRYMLGFLQQIRQESFNRLNALISSVRPTVNFAGAITPYLGHDAISVARETQLIDAFTQDLGVNHYQGLLARNACHFAPFAWYRWLQAHDAARVLAGQAHAAAGPAKASLTNLAWIAQGYADHFIEDCFAPGHLTNKTLVMQWFTGWVENEFYIPVLDWDSVRAVTAAEQPGLMGAPLYGFGGAGPSNDPQTAEEMNNFAARMAATGVKGYVTPTVEQAYHQYLSFLQSSVVQLSSNQVHNYYNENGLKVASRHHPGLFKIYGDEDLLHDGADIAIVSSAVAASQQVITQILDTGQTDVSPWDVLSRLPMSVEDSTGTTVPLLDWHNGDLKKQAPGLFGGIKAIAVGLVSPSLGLVSEDQLTTGLVTAWDRDLGTGSMVSPLWDGRRLYAGSWGQAWELDPSSGAVLHPNSLPGTGYAYDLALDSSSETVFIANNGWAVAADAGNFGTVKWTTYLLNSWNYMPPSHMLYLDDNVLYAACMGNVFELDPAGGPPIGHNGLDGLGWNEVRLAVAGDILVAGTGNVLVGLDRRLHSLAKRWQITLPTSGPAVSIIVVGRWLYAALNGYIFTVDPETGKIGTTFEDEQTGEFRLCTNGANLYRGGAGTVTGHSLPSLEEFFSNTLTPWPNTPVNLLAGGADLFATVNGAVYQLNPVRGSNTYANGLPYGMNECRMTSDGYRLYCGINGHVVALGLKPA